MGRVIVIGGGAAGFFGAIAAAEEGCDVLLLERGKEVLSKVRISGGGRCNVTHNCFEPGQLSEAYPRGKKSLRGPFSRWQPEDTVRWFEERGVALKTEEDGRMFPTTDQSQTIIDCLLAETKRLGVTCRTGCGVTALRRVDEKFQVETAGGWERADTVLIATGGARMGAARKPLEDLGHSMMPPVPSLFTFHIDDERLQELPGLSVNSAHLEVGKLKTEGPVLITHWGLSGPGILKLSALGARELADCDYRFELKVDWTGGLEERALIEQMEAVRRDSGARKVRARSVFAGIPRRLWDRLCAVSGIQEETTWANLKKDEHRELNSQLRSARFPVRGKSLNKEEFVTCGGVPLKEVSLKTMESKVVPGLYLAGEILDVDGITGGFNFQAAWTTGWIAGKAMGASMAQGASSTETR